MLLLGAPLGDVVLLEGTAQPQPLIQSIVGISPGGNLSNHLPIDLSALNVSPGIIGAANQSFHEFFPASPGVPAWDLAGKTITFFGVGIGASGAHYRCLTSP
jgi:hypothetical protein